MAKPLIAIFKVGDQETAPGKEHLGMRDGMLVCYIDPNEWPEGANLSAHMQKVFACVEVPYEWKADLVEGCRPTYEGDDPKQIDPKTYGVRRKKVDFSALSTAVVDPSLEASLRNDTVVPLIDAKSAPKTILKEWDAAAAVEPRTIDRNSVSTGSYTVGSSGHYATWAAFSADLANLTAALTGTQISNVTETALADPTEALGGYTLTITSDSPPAGDPTSGYVTTINHTGGGFRFRVEGPGTVRVEGIYQRRAQNGTNALQAGIIVADIGTAFDLEIYNNMYDGAGYTGNGYRWADPTPVCYVLDNVLWDSGDSGIALDGSDGNASSIYENNTILGCGGVGIDVNNNAGTFRNNAVYGSLGLSGDIRAAAFADGCNNASSDATAGDGYWSTGSGNITSQTAADDFLSLDDTNSSFLKPDPAGALAGAGTLTILADNTTGIEGNPRPNADGTVTIGAGEVLGGGYSRQNLFGQRFGQLHGQGV